MSLQLQSVDAWSTVFARRGWLAEAPDDLRRAMLAEGQRMRLTRGQRVFSPGDPPGGMYGVVSGGIGAEGSTHWHQVRLGHVLREGHWFGYRSALIGGDRFGSFFATEASEIVLVPLLALNALKQSDQRVSRLLSLMAVMTETLLVGIACDLLLRNVRRRIAAVLLRVTGAHEAVVPSDPRGFVITQDQLAEMAAASRNYVNQTLKWYEQQGWIAVSGTRIRLLDTTGLSAFAYLEP